MAALQPCISHCLSLLQTRLLHSLDWRNKFVVKGSSPPSPVLFFSQIRFLIWFITQLNKTTVPANQRAYQRDRNGWLGAKTVLGQHSCQNNCQTALSEGYRVCRDREIYGDTLKRWVQKGTTEIGWEDKCKNSVSSDLFDRSGQAWEKKKLS